MHDDDLPAGPRASCAQLPFDRTVGDVGNIVEFGHLNLRVPDQPMALAFYVTGLGLTRDPYLMTGAGNAWINVGASQFHLPVGRAQVLRGVVGLVMPDLDALAARLDGVRPLLAGTAFAFERGTARIDVTCPWGNRLCVHAPDAARFGRIVLGMPYVECEVPEGAAARIARFYAEVLEAPSTLGQDAAGVFVRVPMGLRESLVFRETARPILAYDGHHLQIAVAAFSRVHARLRERGLVSEESDAHQYRFEDIVDVDTGERLTRLEHEVRSMRHPMHGRRLVNRDPAATGEAYTQEREAFHWLMP